MLITLIEIKKVLDIPFSKEMVRAVFCGCKVCTSRREQKGGIGDVFYITSDDQTRCKFRIVDVQQHTLGFITEKLYLQEGTASPQEFESLWRRLHRGHYDPNKIMYVHWFARIS
jgi:hypothetical protein